MILIIGIHTLPDNAIVRRREAVRGLIFNEQNELLLMQSSEGEYTSIGGGIEMDEDYIETIKRECLEESGYSLEAVEPLDLTVIERKTDWEHNDKEPYYFELTSHYYYAKVASVAPQPRHLSDLEVRLGLEPRFVRLDQAMEHNEKLFLLHGDINFWLEREVAVLKLLSTKLAKKLGK